MPARSEDAINGTHAGMCVAHMCTCVSHTHRDTAAEGAVRARKERRKALTRNGVVVQKQRRVLARAVQVLELRPSAPIHIQRRARRDSIGAARPTTRLVLPEGATDRRWVEIRRWVRIGAHQRVQRLCRAHNRLQAARHRLHERPRGVEARPVAAHTHACQALPGQRHACTVAVAPAPIAVVGVREEVPAVRGKGGALLRRWGR